MEEDRMRRLLELGALIEQQSAGSSVHIEIALKALEDIRDLLLRDPVPPAVEPQATMQVVQPALQVPMPQIWDFQSEPIPEQEIFVDQHPAYNGISESLCFDELDSNQLAQLRDIPFLFHFG